MKVKHRIAAGLAVVIVAAVAATPSLAASWSSGATVVKPDVSWRD